MKKSHTLEVLNQLKEDYQKEVVNVIKTDLINEFNTLKNYGVKSLTIVFEEDDDGNVYFDDMKGFVISTDKKIKTEALPMFALLNVFDNISFMVNNIKLDCDDTIEMSENKVVMNLKYVKNN